MTRIRHIALTVGDQERAAGFYNSIFGLQRVGEGEDSVSTAVLLSDGNVNLALLQYKTDAAAGVEGGRGYIGAHHFGFQVENADAAHKSVEQGGGSIFLDHDHAEREVNFERKFRDPDGIIFDISRPGWTGAAGSSLGAIGHIALSVGDVEKETVFYESALGLRRVGVTTSEIADGVYLSDGVVNLTLLDYKDDEAAGWPYGKDRLGTNHFGFKVDDLEEWQGRIEDHGGTFVLDLPADDGGSSYERKFRDLDGVVFDISERGWVT